MSIPAPASLQGTRVLLVEDDDDIRDVLAQMMRDEGLHVACAANGGEALAHLLRGPPPDVIVLDLMMPVMDGWQFRLEQKKDPTFSAIPVVAMSADASAKAEAIDVDAYVRKPLEFDNLMFQISQVLQQARNRRTATANRMAALGTLAAGIAHEVNNPLAYTMCNLQHLIDRVPPLLSHDAGTRGEIQQLLEEALDGTRRIAQVVKLALLVAPSHPEATEVTDLCTAAETVIARLQTEIRKHGILVTEFEGHPRVMGDRGRIEQIFHTLILNAVQSLSKDSPITQKVRVIIKSLPSDRAVVEVVDNGCGIPVEVQERVFQPFFTTRAIGQGTGLGLSICQGIVTALGGQLTFESEVGRGSTFRAVLPTTAQPAAVQEVSPIAREIWPGGRILVVDEEPIMMRAVKYMLGPGHEVAFANSAEEAIAILDEGADFDAILCELMLRKVNGLEFMDMLTRKHPSLANRVVLMSACAMTTEMRRFLDGSGVPYIGKPFDSRQLVRAIAARTAVPDLSEAPRQALR